MAGLVGRLVVADHGQCDRRCAAEGRGVGERTWTGPQSCLCADASTIARLNPSDGPVPPGTIVCGADGTTYPDAASAGQTRILHKGACGTCSNDSDIAAYQTTAATLTGIAEKCAFANVVFGEAVGTACFKERSGLSSACIDCWIDNMSCTSVHCLGVCMKARLRGDPRNKPDGSLNDCLACDEAYCGGPFIQCAGANRRRAGIISDIQRPDAQVWKPR